jgi:hypothetical protein
MCAADVDLVLRYVPPMDDHGEARDALHYLSKRGCSS